MAAHIALEETGSPYEAIEISLSKKQNKTPEYLKLNPRGTVPALLIDDELLTENTAILTYVGRRFRNSGLLPDDLLEEARCISQMAWLSNTPHIARRRFMRPQRFCSSEHEEAGVKANGRNQFWEALQEIDSLLTDREWVMGSRYTVVDPYALVFYRWGLRDGHPMDKLGSYKRLADQLLTRRAVRSVLAREQDTVLLP
jgi:glutathione S-transferase